MLIGESYAFAPHRQWGDICGLITSIFFGLYVLAVRHGLLSVVSVIVTLYPASTMVLATTVDKERIHRSQAVGILLAAVALVLITVA
mgnify:CR=1 FL=1